TAKLYDIMSKFILNGMLDEESAVWVTIVWAVTLQKIEAKEGQQVMENCRSILPELQKKRSPICISHDPISNLVTVNASPIDQIHKKGKCYHNQGNYDEAIRCYDRALSINPQDYNI